MSIDMLKDTSFQMNVAKEIVSIGQYMTMITCIAHKRAGEFDEVYRNIRRPAAMFIANQLMGTTDFQEGLRMYVLKVRDLAEEELGVAK